MGDFFLKSVYQRWHIQLEGLQICFIKDCDEVFRLFEKFNQLRKAVAEDAKRKKLSVITVVELADQFFSPLSPTKVPRPKLSI